MALLARRVPTSIARGASRVAPVPVGKVASRQARPLEQRRVCAQAEAQDTTGTVDTEKVLKDLQEKWDKVENKPQVALYTVGGVFALWLTATVIGAINNVPILPKALELVGLGYSAWFTYRYLLFKASREELIKDVEELKGKITGN